MEVLSKKELDALEGQLEILKRLAPVEEEKKSVEEKIKKYEDLLKLSEGISKKIDPTELIHKMRRKGDFY